ncbi:hypothetical protein [Corynebacterium fournieri]|uniref:hypothetical protein n=1 Tax=Corynebacterium fournieri TaxID=1852390 RepID=UPI000A2F2A01|nr:hypothetical protein [Corynebacterium fournieri]WJY98610.1 hypothetical protein CFOUR_11160 [Corynebacterium fournieri]
MKRIATAAVAATLSLSAVAAPALAADAGAPKVENTGSSEYYTQCKTINEKNFAEFEARKAAAKTDEEKAKIEKEQAENFGNYNSSTLSGVCIKGLMDERNGHRSSILGLLIGVPVALVALLGAAAAFSGAIPGFSLPALPGLPM